MAPMRCPRLDAAGWPASRRSRRAASTSVRQGARPVTTSGQALVDRATRRAAASVTISASEPPDDVADVPEPVDRRDGVGAGVGRPIPSASSRMTPSPTRGAPRRCPVGAPARRELPRGDHPRQRVGRGDVGQLEPARRAHRRQVGMPGQHGDRRGRRARPGWPPRGPACRRGHSGSRLADDAGARRTPGRAAAGGPGPIRRRPGRRRTPSARSSGARARPPASRPGPRAPRAPGRRRTGRTAAASPRPAGAATRRLRRRRAWSAPAARRSGSAQHASLAGAEP